MKRTITYVFIFFTLIFGIGGSCKKSSGGGGGGGGEPTLQVTLNPPANSTQPAAPGTDFPLTVTITSVIPAQGVTIDVAAKKDDGSGELPFFVVSNMTTTISINPFNITGTPLNVICITTVTVTSKTSSTNKWTGSYRYSRKP